MDLALAYKSRSNALTAADARRAAKISRVEVFDDMLSAEPYWRKLEAGHALATPYQHFDLLAAWQHHVGVRCGVRPFIVIGFDGLNEPAFLWPFGRTQAGPFGIVHFLGAKHANFNLGVWRRDVVTSVGLSDLRRFLGWIALGDHPVDAVALTGQPVSWDGMANPFALLPHQPSADWSGRLEFPRAEPNVSDTLLSSSMRGRLRTKERKLQKLPGYRYIRATEAGDIDRLLDQFFALKSAHMAAQGLPNVFAAPGVAEFLRESCHRRLANGDPLLELHALEGGGEVLALFGGIADRYRFSAMINTYTLGDHARQSPGLILLIHMVNGIAARGIRSFDIGVGRAHYKEFFCKDPEPRFDSFLPLSARGRLVAAGYRAQFVLKRTIKDSAILWRVVQYLRRLKAKL